MTSTRPPGRLQCNRPSESEKRLASSMSEGPVVPIGRTVRAHVEIERDGFCKEKTQAPLICVSWVSQKYLQIDPTSTLGNVEG